MREPQKFLNIRQLKNAVQQRSTSNDDPEHC